MAGVVDADGRDERGLARGASVGAAVAAFTSQVGIINLDQSFDGVGSLALGHGAHDLVVHQPGGGVAQVEVALERGCRQARLGLTEQVDRHKPRRQRQLRAGEDSCL